MRDMRDTPIYNIIADEDPTLIRDVGKWAGITDANVIIGNLFNTFTESVDKNLDVLVQKRWDPKLIQRFNILVNAHELKTLTADYYPDYGGYYKIKIYKGNRVYYKFDIPISDLSGCTNIIEAEIEVPPDHYRGTLKDYLYKMDYCDLEYWHKYY